MRIRATPRAASTDPAGQLNNGHRLQLSFHSPHFTTRPASLMPCSNASANRCSTTMVAPDHCQGSDCTFKSNQVFARSVNGQSTQIEPQFLIRTSGAAANILEPC